MSFKVHDVHGLDADQAASELLSTGMVAIDDVSWQLVDCAWDEVLEALGHAADDLVLKRQRVETSWGPVLVIRDSDVVTAAAARRQVLTCRQAPVKAAQAEPNKALHHPVRPLRGRSGGER